MMPGTEPSRNAAEQPASPSRRQQAIEIVIFLSLIVPSSVLASFAYRQERATFGLVAWATMLRDVTLVALIWYFVWRNGEPTRAIGWRFRWVDLLLGLVLYGPFLLFASLVETLFRGIGLSMPSGPAPSFLVPHGTADFVLAFVLVVVVAISEETIFRGYLLLRLRGSGSNVFWAVVISAVLFSLGHGYEGSAGMATVGTMGAIFAIIYLWRGSLAAPVTMHFLQDFIGIVLLPLLGHGR